MKGRARDLAAAGALMERAVASPGFSPAARRVAEAPIAPKPDPLTAEERAEVERKLASGEVTRCPPRKHAIDGATVLTREEFKAMRGRVAARDMKFRRLRERSGQAEEASERSGEGPPPEPERQPAPAADASKHDPRVDKCACGRWKTRGKPRCKHCHGRHACRRQLQESAAAVDKPAADSDPVAAAPSPPLRVRRSGFLWWVCAEDGTRVAGPYGERKLALAAAESGGA